MRLILAVTSALAVLAASPRAEACGGTFCDAGPMTAAVDQAAETILFVRDAGIVEAHIQIAIDPDTDAQKFAWLVPMPAVPEFAIGSQPLFDALLGASAPRYDLRGDSCGYPQTTIAFISDPDGGGASVDPDIHSETVGAFTVTTLEGGTADAVMTWLGDNGYAQDEAAEPIIASYLADDFVLVAFRLTPQAGIRDVHPIVLRYAGDEPCVPLRLTAIAAQDDMGVRAFFLDEARWAPTNYRHVVLNPLQVRWGGGGYDYAAAITLAVDEAPQGHGFVTEYAGTTSMVPTGGIYSDTWASLPFSAAAPTSVVDLLNAQGLAMCPKGGPCIVPHPLVVALLREYLPAPADVSENQFYECLSCYADQTDFAEWDGPAFAADLETRVIEPGRHGALLLESWPYVTRLFTTISPHEMTLDPTFEVAPDLPDVPLSQPAIATCVDCEGDAIGELPDGREVYLEGASWPSFARTMPFAERIEQIPAQGAPIVELDNRADIDAALAAYNAKFECMPGGTGSGSGSGQVDGSGTASDPTGGGMPLDTGTGGSESEAGQDGGTGGQGCACTNAPAPGFSPLLALLVLLRRRARG
ncbi:MAG TPA: DUF2330 domain-containing protein [Nannocystaceae bacterium]|nr:DUF2330 domain-containing protein [Nannocystaceae bacterium]